MPEPVIKVAVMNLRPLLVLPPLAVGILGFIWMTTRPDPQVGAPPEAELAVRSPGL